MCIVSDDGYFKVLNPAFEKTLGFTLEELKSKSFLEFIHPDDVPRTEAQVEHLKTGGVTARFENRYLCKDGTYKWLSWGAYVGKNGLRYGIAFDSTETRQIAEKMQQTQKMESIGRLAGGIAHDLNNFLTVISGYVELCLDSLPESSEERGFLQEVSDAADSAGRLSEQLVAFSRKKFLSPSVLNIKEIIEKVVSITAVLTSGKIQIVSSLNSEVPPIYFDAGQVEQILTNLILNAFDAITEKGKLIIETGTLVVDIDESTFNLDLEPGTYTEVKFVDNGIGMDEETSRRVFEPFFTTKDQGTGTGLGLSSVYGLLKQSGGGIWLQSQLGVGTTFRVFFPTPVTEEKQLCSKTEEKAITGQNSGTILVLDDQITVLGFVSKVLEMSGYTVLKTSDVEEAEFVFKENRSEIDLLLTDIVMPQRSGVEVARQLRDLSPDLKVIYMSGFADHDIVKEGLTDEKGHLLPGITLLEKPLSRSRVLEAVGEVLNRE